jgi:sulfatase-like protein
MRGMRSPLADLLPIAELTVNRCPLLDGGSISTHWKVSPPFPAMHKLAGNVKTPTLDRLAAEGMKCHRFFTAAPQCVPSRSALMTGRSPVAARMTRFSSPLPRDEVTFPELLRERDYWREAVTDRRRIKTVASVEIAQYWTPSAIIAVRPSRSFRRIERIIVADKVQRSFISILECQGLVRVAVVTHDHINFSLIVRWGFRSNHGCRRIKLQINRILTCK